MLKTLFAHARDPVSRILSEVLMRNSLYGRVELVRTDYSRIRLFRVLLPIGEQYVLMHSTDTGAFLYLPLPFYRLPQVFYGINDFLDKPSLYYIGPLVALKNAYGYCFVYDPLAKISARYKFRATVVKHNQHVLSDFRCGIAGVHEELKPEDVGTGRIRKASFSLNFVNGTIKTSLYVQTPLKKPVLGVVKRVVFEFGGEKIEITPQPFATDVKSTIALTALYLAHVIDFLDTTAYGK